MSDESSNRERTIFDASLQLPETRRAEFIRRECGGDHELEDRVRRLLAAHQLAEERGTLDLPDAGVLEAPEIVGPYRVLSTIGEGGMGVVYLAEQVRPIRRRVAVKVIKLGMDTKQVIARFDSERQALALMTHPNIARILDAGTTEQGRPYFVMEYVPGEPLTKYCDRRRLDLRRRLELFVRVCVAVQHAHQKGVIHRDLKPSNILVMEGDEGPVPKVIDFGIAKATERQLGELTVQTELDQPIGTLEYMSPEQAERTGLGVDTRTDVYALGVVLYELMVGARPLVLRDPERGFAERLQDLQSVEHTPLPKRLAQLGEMAGDVARSRRATPESLRRKLRGELEAITDVALAKDRERRYQSAHELAADVRRHLRHEPVVARSPGIWYRGGKFVRRHAAAVAASAAAAAMIVGLISYYTLQLAAERDRARQEAERANREQAAAEQVSSFLTELFRVSDPNEARGRTVTARELLDLGARRIEQELGDQPEVQARLMDTIGGVYLELGLYDDASKLLRAALDLRCQVLGEEHPDVAVTLDKIAYVLEKQEDFEAAEALFRQVLAMRRELLGEADPLVGSSLNNLALLLYQKGEYDEAERLHRVSLARSRQLWGDEHTDVAASLSNLAMVLSTMGDQEGAEPLYREALEIWRRLLGEDHPHVAATSNNLATLYFFRAAYDDAVPLFRHTLELQRKLLGEEHPDVATTMNNLGLALSRMGNVAAAEPMLRRALELRRQLLGEDHPLVAASLGNLASAIEQSGNYEEALRLVGDALTIYQGSLSPDHWRTAQMQSRYGEALMRLGRHGDAEGHLLRGHSGLEAVLGAPHERTQTALGRIVELYEESNQPQLADRYRARLGDGGESTQTVRPPAGGSPENVGVGQERH